MGPAIMQRNANAAMRVLGKSMFPLEKQPGVLSQLNRSLRRPVMADLRQCGCSDLEIWQGGGYSGRQISSGQHTEIQPGKAWPNAA